MDGWWEVRCEVGMGPLCYGLGWSPTRRDFLVRPLQQAPVAQPLTFTDNTDHSVC